MQHANRVDEIKTLEGERRVVQIGLDHVNVSRLCVSSRYLNCRTKIDGPDFGAILGRVVSKASIATTRIENLFPRKEVGGVRLHVVEKLLFPLVVHFRKTMPLVTKTQRRFGLSLIVSGGFPFARQRSTHVGKQQPRNVVDDWIRVTAASAGQLFCKRKLRATARAAQRFQ